MIPLTMMTFFSICKSADASTSFDVPFYLIFLHSYMHFFFFYIMLHCCKSAIEYCIDPGT